jgi:hypothetical protein
MRRPFWPIALGLGIATGVAIGGFLYWFRPVNSQAWLVMGLIEGLTLLLLAYVWHRARTAERIAAARLAEARTRRPAVGRPVSAPPSRPRRVASLRLA